MRWLNVARARWRALFGREAVIRDIDEELRAHVEMEAEANVRRGMSPAEARRAARLSFGNYDGVRDAAYTVRGGGMTEALLEDVRYGARMLWKRPGFTLVAVVTLALGIGANTAIFSVVNAVLLRSLPLPEPERLVALSETSKKTPSMAVAFPNYLDWRARQTVFAEMAARMPAGGVLTGDGEPERITGRLVTASFFRTLAVRPAAGRFFTEDEDRPGGPSVMVISHGLWQRRYGLDPSVVGRTILYNGEPWTVAGVMPQGFDFYGANNANNDFFIPLGPLFDQPFMHDRRSHTVMVTARLRPGVTVEQARAEMATIAAGLEREHPSSNAGNGVALDSLLDDYVGDVRPALLTVSAAVLLVLLIACANVANLLLARAPARRKEVAVRTALGASRGRVVRQLLVESLLLASAGGAAGLLLAWWGVELLTGLNPDGMPRLDEITLDARVLVFTLGVTLATAVAFGLAPALQTSKVDLNDALKEGGRGASGGAGSKRLRHALVAAEVAVSLMLLVGAGLLVKSFRQLTRADAGFDPRGVLTLRLRLPDAKYREAGKAVGLLREVVQRVGGLPEVEGACVATGFPLGRGRDHGYTLEGEPEPQTPADWSPSVSQSIGEGYFKVLGIGLLAGRDFDGRDTAESPRVVVVDDAFVRRHFAGAPPEGVLGKRLRFGGEDEPWREVVGVVKHVRHNSLEEEEGRVGVYQPWTQIKPRWLADTARAMDLIVKTRAEPAGLVPAIRREVRALDPDQPLANVRTLQSFVDEAVAPRRFSAALVGAFALVALLLGAVGLYGVMSYAVSQRTHEIGIRMALGAQRGRILRGVLAQGMALVLVGVGVGMAGSLAAARLIAGQLYGVRPTDPAIILGVAALLMAVALAACFIPARRATKVDPMVALRYE